MDWGLVFWTTALLIPLVLLVRKAHSGLQELFLLLTDHDAAAIYLFQILLFPGVVLHESSHYVAAKILGVRVRKISLRPELRGQRVQMGAVVMDRPDFIRALFIGLAPLITGCVAVVLIGHRVFDVGRVIEAATAGDSASLVEAVRVAYGVNDAWIWLYLIFAISNAMLPSESDRESLMPVVAFIALGLAVIVAAGWSSMLLANLAQPIEATLSLLLIAFGITVFVDTGFVGLIALLKLVLGAVTQRRLENEI
jgi:hypothetical protein